MKLRLIAAATLAGALGFVLSCGSKASCSPSSCTGCCSATGTCELGVALSACGKGGVACAACTGAQICGSLGCQLPSGSGGGSATGGGSAAGGGSATGGGSGFPPPPGNHADPTIVNGTCSGASCTCDGGSPCTVDCGLTQSCSIDCNSNTSTCQGSCQGACYLDCNSAHGCAANCGANCYVDCNSEQGNCAAIVDAGAYVDCNSLDGGCTVECLGSCTVDCTAARDCRVRCDSGPDAGCDVSYTSDTGTLCPDGKTKVCGATPCG